jgi:hypothetical protein
MSGSGKIYLAKTKDTVYMCDVTPLLLWKFDHCNYRTAVALNFDGSLIALSDQVSLKLFRNQLKTVE